jgi:SAM-dependent methyltransferase
LLSSVNEVINKDFSVVTTETREGGGLWEKCNHCGLVVNRTGVLPSEVKNYYNNEYQISNSFERGSRVSPRDRFLIRKKSIRNRAEYLLQFLSKESIVFELGAGTGELLHLLMPNVESCYGNEICQEFSDFMREELEINVIEGDYLQSTPNTSWDMVISICTIDHLFNPRDFLEKIYCELRPGGILYIEVPNDEQALKKYVPGRFGNSFKRFMYQTAHYYSFNFDTLQQLLLDVGFLIEDKFSRHDYSLINYLNWCLVGGPQLSISDAKSGEHFFLGDTEFESEMNDILTRADREFRGTITKHLLGESICVTARKR